LRVFGYHSPVQVREFGYTGCEDTQSGFLLFEDQDYPGAKFYAVSMNLLMAHGIVADPSHYASLSLDGNDLTLLLI